MAKLPSFQFYPGDWMKDPELRSVSPLARGIWIDCLCLMFEAPTRGFLLSAKGTPYTAEHLSRMTGASIDEVRAGIRELEESGVLSVSDDTKAIYCRRMVRDEYLRSVRAAGGRLGGNPSLVGCKVNCKVGGMVGNKVNLTPNLQPTPSSSSSYSSSSSTSASTPPTRFEETLNQLMEALAVPQDEREAETRFLGHLAAKIEAHASRDVLRARLIDMADDYTSRYLEFDKYRAAFFTAALDVLHGN